MNGTHKVLAYADRNIRMDRNADVLKIVLYNIYAFFSAQWNMYNLGLDMNGTHQVLAYADDNIRMERIANVLRTVII